MGNQISVAMACYNGTRFIGEQLESILRQSLPAREIIIVDDRSTDNSIEIIKAYQSKYPQIQLVCNEVNVGVTKTFEKAISLCTGELIAPSDQDDIWLPHKLQALAENIGEFDAAYANAILVDENGKSLGKEFRELMNLGTYTTGAPFLLSNTVPGHSMLIKKRFIDKIIPFPAHLYFDLWIAYHAAASNGIKYVDEVLVKYRQHQSNAVGTRHSDNRRVRIAAQEEFLRKRKELATLAASKVPDSKTQEIVDTMLRHFHRRWSFSRSAFFFKKYRQILAGKNKPLYRKILYCVKMFFKPNF